MDSTFTEQSSGTVGRTKALYFSSSSIKSYLVVVLFCMVLGGYGQTDSCHSAHTDEKSCMADDKCAWCICEALPSSAGQRQMQWLPSGVYKCTNSSLGGITGNTTGNVMLMSLTNPGSPLGKQHCPLAAYQSRRHRFAVFQIRRVEVS